jgi:hypothetical protein
VIVDGYPRPEECLMRIALIAGPYLPVPSPGYGGTEAVLDGLARGLATRGHDVVLYSTGDASDGKRPRRV